MSFFNFWKKDNSENKAIEEIEFTQGGSNFEERIGPFGERVQKGECRKIRYKGSSEEIKRILGNFPPRIDRSIEGSNEIRRLPSTDKD